MKYAKIAALSALCFFISSCSYFYGEQGLIQNRDTDYLKATSIPPLRIPPGLSSSTITAEYPVSEKEYPEGAKRVNLVPPELNPN